MPYGYRKRRGVWARPRRASYKRRRITYTTYRPPPRRPPRAVRRFRFFRLVVLLFAVGALVAWILER